MRLVPIALLASTLALASPVLGRAHTHEVPQIALTFDDLPVHGPIPVGDTAESVGKGVISALTSAHVPAYGFVNAHWVAEQPETLSVLKAWRDAGLPLGNHTWSHQHLRTLSIAEFEQEVARDEPLLEQLAGTTDWHWLRYPFLEEGRDPAQRSAARQVLASRHYKIADVTMDFADWQWTAPYSRCRSSGDLRAITELGEMYLAAAKDSIGFYRGLSHTLYGRDIPYVILLHESAFEARMLPQLIKLLRSQGFRFVSLPAAEKDPFYYDRVHPELPAGPPGLVEHALAAGIILPPHADYAAKLSAMCPSPNAATQTP